MSDPFATPSDGSKMLLMGHRGVGTCEEQELHKKKCTESGLPIPERIRENTLRAMLVTHAAGGHFVEFDVQLSRDRVPIIYHDFYTGDGRFVGDLTLAELQALNDHDGFPPDQHQYSTLESFFTQLPEELGFDVEIKYPMRYLNEQDGASLCPEFHWSITEYVSTITDAVKSLHASTGPRRRIFYSCFVSEVCLLLRQLHPACPVVFLLNAKKGHKFTEVHGVSGRAALEFAASAGLQGVALHSEELLAAGKEEATLQFLADCKRLGVRCLTWGPENNTSQARSLQRSWGVDGVIFDNIHAGDDI